MHKPQKPARQPQRPRRTVTRHEASDELGISLDSFERHVQPHLRVIRCGRLVLIPERELSRWVEQNAARALGANG